MGTQSVLIAWNKTDQSETIIGKQWLMSSTHSGAAGDRHFLINEDWPPRRCCLSFPAQYTLLRDKPHGSLWGEEPRRSLWRDEWRGSLWVAEFYMSGNKRFSTFLEGIHLRTRGDAFLHGASNVGRRVGHGMGHFIVTSLHWLVLSVATENNARAWFRSNHDEHTRATVELGRSALPYITSVTWNTLLLPPSPGSPSHTSFPWDTRSPHLRLRKVLYAV